MQKKKPDLQAIRGIAIISVILFHFFPKYFPNGYVGVDQFFVLSGYLIAMILGPNDINSKTILTFYYRRIRRIVPLYIFFVFLVLIALFTVFPQTDIELNIESARHAMTFTTNIEGISPDKAYAIMLELAVDSFTHTWSLAVEMQFYLVVPLLFLVSGRYRKYVIIIVGTASFLHSVTTDTNTAFNSVLCRLWQFCVGIGSFMIDNVSDNVSDEAPEAEKEMLFENAFGDDDDTPSNHRESVLNHSTLFTCMVLLTTLAQVMYNVIVPPALLRCNITILTGGLIIIGTNQKICIMSNRVPVYFGDISYALYLVHWPIYTYVKLTYGDNFLVLCAALLLSILLAIGITETFEKYYLQLDKIALTGMISVLYGMCIVMVMNSSSIRQHLQSKILVNNMYDNISRDDVIRMNEQWNNNDQPQLRNLTCIERNGICKFMNPTNATVEGPSILILGNSWSANIAEVVNESCKKMTSKIVLYWIVACPILVNAEIPGMMWCGKNVTDSFMEIVEREKPDIMFLLVGHNVLMSPIITNGSIFDDLLYKEAEERMRKFESLVNKTIYVLQAMPTPPSNIIQTLYNGIKSNKLPRMSSIPEPFGVRNAQIRLEELVSNCQKCKMIDYSPYFMDGIEFQYYDKSNGLSYFTDGTHLTPLAQQKVKPMYEKLCKAI